VLAKICIDKPFRIAGGRMDGQHGQVPLRACDVVSRGFAMEDWRRDTARSASLAGMSALPNACAWMIGQRDGPVIQDWPKSPLRVGMKCC